MARIAESELILNPDGSVYHLKLLPGQIAHDIILVGDPQRVERISQFFDQVELKIQNREIITHTGFYKGKRISALSTGMGTDNIDIVINELDALVNIDLKTRTIHDTHTPLRLVRLGTSGAVQPEIPLNTFVVSSHAIGIDNLMHFYTTRYTGFDTDMAEAFGRHCEWPSGFSQPYAAKASEELLQKLGTGFMQGITVTAPGFYAPQGRQLRLQPAISDLEGRLESFRFGNLKINNFEMETSALYGLSALLGHEALTICVAIANRHRKEYNKDYKIHMDELIRTTLERLSSL
jgi:uridine phosphorylase